MPILVFVILMVALLLFILWDRKKPAKTVSREQMSKGFTPGNVAKWQGLLLISLAGFSLAFSEFWNPSVPPFSGRGSTLQAWAFHVLGERGLAFIWLAFAAVLAVAAYVAYRSKQKN